MARDPKDCINYTELSKALAGKKGIIRKHIDPAKKYRAKVDRIIKAIDEEINPKPENQNSEKIAN